MEKKREDRYASITELALDLEAYLKNRVLPSTIRQNPLEQQKIPFKKRRTEGSFLRRLHYLWVANYRQIPRPMRRLLLAGLISAVLLSAAVILLMPASGPAVQARREPDPLTAEKILAGLARQAAVYLPDQDYEPVMDLYRNYSGSLADETRAVRLQIADGYQLTQRLSASDLVASRAELLLQGSYEQAMELFEKRHGSNLCPQCRVLIQELLGLPRQFQSYWQERRGLELTISFIRYGRILLKINDADQSEVYAVRMDNRRQMRFKFSDLTQEEQLKIIGKSGSLCDFQTGIFLLQQGKTEEAAAAFEKVPVFGPALVRQVRSRGDPQASDRGSDRSR